MFCKKCGKAIEDDAAFCSSCGQSMSEGESPANEVQVKYAEVPTRTGQLEKAPEFGERVLSTTTLDPYYKGFKWTVNCIGIWLFFKIAASSDSFIISIIAAVIIVKAAKVAYEFIRGTKLLDGKKYSSYITETMPPNIVPYIAGPLLAHNMKVTVYKGIFDNSSKEVIQVTYRGRTYDVNFYNNPGCFFTVCTGSNLTNKVKYGQACEDVPIIAFYIQDTLRNM